MKKYRVAIETASMFYGIVEYQKDFMTYREALDHYNAIKLDYRGNVGKYIFDMDKEDILKSSHSKLFWIIYDNDVELMKAMMQRGNYNSCHYTFRERKKNDYNC